MCRLWLVPILAVSSLVHPAVAQGTPKELLVQELLAFRRSSPPMVVLEGRAQEIGPELEALFSAERIVVLSATDSTLTVRFDGQAMTLHLVPLSEGRTAVVVEGADSTRAALLVKRFLTAKRRVQQSP